MIKILKKMTNWYFNTITNSIYLTPTGMIPFNYYGVK